MSDTMDTLFLIWIGLGIVTAPISFVIACYVWRRNWLLSQALVRVARLTDENLDKIRRDVDYLLEEKKNSTYGLQLIALKDWVETLRIAIQQTTWTTPPHIKPGEHDSRATKRRTDAWEEAKRRIESYEEGWYEPGGGGGDGEYKKWWRLEWPEWRKNIRA